MKKCINYLLFFGVLLFVSCYKVEAASIEISCRYSNANKSVYLYCYGNNEDKCDALYVTRDGNKYKFKSKKVIEVVFGENNTCPSYANKDSYIFGIGYKGFKFGKGVFGKEFVLIDEDYTGKYNEWTLADSASDILFGDYKYSVTFNKFGFLTYSGTIDSVVINDFDGSKPTFNSTLFTEEGKFEFDTKVDNSDKGNSDKDDDSTFDKDDVGSGDVNSLGVGGYCVYKNIGVCAGNDGNINGDCPGVYTGTAEKNSHYFVRSKYAVFKYNTLGGADTFDNVYLPNYTESNGAYVINPSIEGRVDSNFNAFNGKLDRLETLLKDFTVFSKNNVASLYSINYSNEKENGCPVWISDIDGAGGHDYEDAQYFYQYYNKDEEDNDRGEDAEIADPGAVVEPGKGPYYCIYDGEYGSTSKKTGSLALFYDPDSSRLKLISYDFSQAYLNTTCALSDCKLVDGVKFVGYGGAEGNDGSFQSNFISASTATCPKQINFNYTNNLLTICKDDFAECVNGEWGILGKINRFSNSFEKSSGSSSVSINDCSDLIDEDLRQLLNKYFNIFRILVPIIVIVLGIVDFVKATFASKEDDMKKAQSAFVKRLIVCVIIFLIPTFVNVLMDVANTVWGWNAGTCDIENVDSE